MSQLLTHLKGVLLIYLLLFVVKAQAQLPTGYGSPIQGPILLAGNFGECRPNHFHAGLDIKTGGKENMDILAVADGYVARLKMEVGGYGHVIYLNHPDGHTSVYAHLNDFYPALQARLRAEQYKRRSWTLDLTFEPDEFPVKKGQFIAYSGNTGGSTAPHLHFEIRDTKTERALNPNSFGYLVEDNIAPTVYDMYLYAKAQSLYYQKPLKLGPNAAITTGDSLVYWGVHLNDYMNNSSNTLAIKSIEWYLDNALQGRLELEDIGFDETRYLHAMIDYSAFIQQKKWIILLYKLPNNLLKKVYQQLNEHQGAMALKPNVLHHYRIDIRDNNNNLKQLKGTIQYQANSLQKATPFTPHGDYIKTDDFWCQWNTVTFYDNIQQMAVGIVSNHTKPVKYGVLSDLIPSHYPFKVGIRQPNVWPFEKGRQVVMAHQSNNKTQYKPVELIDQYYTTEWRTFGTYWLTFDSVAPQIKVPNNLSVGSNDPITVTIDENMSGVKSFSGTVNGQWLCFEQFGNKWIYRVDDYLPVGKHTIDITVEDYCGNRNAISFTVNRR